jgi:hypothetical protein
MSKKVPKMSLADIEFAKKEIEAWRDRQRGAKVTWRLLEKAIGFSRQAMAAKEELAELYHEAKGNLKEGSRPRPARSDDFLEDKILHLTDDVERYKKLEADWLERWVRIAFHARGKGLSIDDLDRPLPPIVRK